jgi:O-succinylbenzoate synthase
MRIDAVELNVVALPLVAPFVAAHGTVVERTLVLVRVLGPDAEGWGECAALPAPTYTSEFTDGALLALRDHLVPALLAEAAVDSEGLPAADVGRALRGVVGHPMAKAALELAVLDAEGRRSGQSLTRMLLPARQGATVATVPGGVALGLHPDPDALAAQVAARVAEGYRRVKVKIAPGRDVDFARAARDAAGPEVVLVLDANAAYRFDADPGAPDDARVLSALDDVGAACLEQPLPADALLDHAELARRVRTPICLDESLTSIAMTRQALDMGACSVVCVKAPRYGSWLTAVDVLDHCHGNGVPAWIGGMLDGGVGRTANLALAAHPGATLPGDISATSRFFTDDVTSFVAPTGGGPPIRFAVPDGPGTGATVDPGSLARLTRRVETIRATAPT